MENPAEKKYIPSEIKLKREDLIISNRQNLGF